MALKAVCAQSDDLDASSSEIGCTTSDLSELSGADGGEVCGVREQNSPRVANPFMEFDWALDAIRLAICSTTRRATRTRGYLSSLSFKVGGDGSKSERGGHVWSEVVVEKKGVRVERRSHGVLYSVIEN